MKDPSVWSNAAVLAHASLSRDLSGSNMLAAAIK